jgi:hypothetical protein
MVLAKTNAEYSVGYKISKHPRCASNHFCNKENTDAENKQNALDFLERLNNGEITIDNPVRTLPIGIQKSGTAYRVYWMSKNSGRIIKNFNSKQHTKATLDICNGFGYSTSDMNKVQRLNGFRL